LIKNNTIRCAISALLLLNFYLLSGQKTEPYFYCIDNHLKLAEAENGRDVIIIINANNCPVYVHKIVEFKELSEKYKYKLKIIPLNIQNREAFQLFINETIGISELISFFEYDSALNACLDYFKTPETIIFQSGLLKKTVDLYSDTFDFSFFNTTKEFIAKVSYSRNHHLILAHTIKGLRILTYNHSAHNIGTFIEYFDISDNHLHFSGYWQNEDLIRSFYKIIFQTNTKFEEAWSKRSGELKNRMIASTPELVLANGEYKDGYFYFSGEFNRINFNQQGQWSTTKHSILLKLDINLKVSDFWLFPQIVQMDKKENFTYSVFHHFFPTNIFIHHDTIISPVAATEVLNKTKNPEMHYFLAKFHLGNKHQGKFVEVLKYEIPHEKTEIFNFHNLQQYYLWKNQHDGYKASFVFSPLVFYLNHPSKKDTLPQSCLTHMEIKAHVTSSPPGKTQLHFYLRTHTLDVKSGIAYFEIVCLNEKMIYKLNPKSGKIEFTGIVRSEKDFHLLYISEEYLYYYVPTGNKEAYVYKEMR
jgi:hypothetical protein